MPVDNFRDLHAFFVVARERSFTRAATELGLSQSALSHKIRGLEATLGVRLLTRTTRSVSPTEAGERLVQFVAPRFSVISAVMSDLAGNTPRPSRTIRIRACDFAATSVLLPRIATSIDATSDLKVEIAGYSELPANASDTVEMYVQFGAPTARNVHATRVSAVVPMAIVGAPSYFETRGAVPMRPSDLIKHASLAVRGVGYGEVDAWELVEREKSKKAHINALWTFNAFSYALDAALSGMGLALLPEPMIREHLVAGRLQAILNAFAPIWPALHLVHDDDEQTIDAVRTVVEALRAR